jgi:hypothetical protein
MARADDHSPLAHRDAAADLSGVDLILECERAARPAGQEWTAGHFYCGRDHRSRNLSSGMS